MKGMKIRSHEGGETQRYMQQVFMWMFLGMLISAVAAFVVATNETLASLILGTWLFYALIILELVLVFVLVLAVKRVSALTATFLFLGYALLTGLTLSVILLVYSIGSIFLTFVVSAAIFGGMAFYGWVTKADLSRIGIIMFFGLIGIIIAALINLFLQNSMLDLIISVIGVLVFTGLTAYDIQKIKQLNILGNEGTDEDRKEAIMGALTLYLDFINLFLSLLRLMGKKHK
ncbi:Bax inhibitor-1/YccA family protein [Candidatus Pacearchaeota archaeon]|nr:Bax inhibitor-1/YccA family protein [Candidatus Pacearchaeota archaeon]